MSELFIVLARYGVMALLVWLAQKGIIPQEQVKGIGDQIVNLLPGIGAALIPVWAGFVRFNTRAVPIATANRADVPTVSPITGATEPGPSRTK